MNKSSGSPENNPINRSIRMVVLGVLLGMVLVIAAINLPGLIGQNSGSNAGSASMPQVPAPPAVGKAMSDISLNDINGNPVKLSNFKGKTILLVFFATWCPHCATEAPLLQKVYQIYKSQGLEVVAVSTFSRNAPLAAAEARDFARQYNWSFTTMVDTNNISQQYGVTGVPHNILVDSTGIVRSVQSGGLDEASMVKIITSYLNK